MSPKLSTPVLLNLAGELLTEELRAYFSDRGIRVIEPTEEKHEEGITHLLTKGLKEFNPISRAYQTLKNDIKIISLSHVEDVRDFIASNGKLIFDEIWLNGPLGAFVLDKFFQEYAGITLGDNYPSFKEKGAFSVINPFNTGEYLDRMVHQAFEHEIQALSVKTYFDHILMYLTGLKQKGKVGVPLEVTYGTYEDTFAVQMHFFAQGLLMEDVTSCMSSAPTRVAEERLLSIAVESADFFDFTFLSQVSKVVVTAIWTKSAEIKVENRGLMFANLSSAASITEYPSEGTTFGLMNSGEIQDLTSHIHLPESESETEEVQISGEKFSEQLAQKISSSVELEKIRQIIRGDISDEELTEVVSGGEEAGEQDIITLHSHDQIDEIVNLVKATIDEKKPDLVVPGQQFSPDDFVVRIASSVEAQAENKNWRVKSLPEQLPKTLKSGLFDFAIKLNKTVHDLTPEDLEAFKEFEVPEIIKNHTKVVSPGALAVVKDLRVKLETSLKQEFMENSIEKIMDSVNTPEDVARVRALLRSTLKSSLDENFQLSEKESISKEEQDILVKTLSVSLAEEEPKIRAIVTNEQANAVEKKTLFKNEPSTAEKELFNKLEAASEENKLLKSKMRTLLSEVKALQNAKAKMAQLQAKAEVEALEFDDDDEKLRKELQDKAQQASLSTEEQKKLSELLERETKLIAMARSEEIRTRKVEIESRKKEALFLQEIEKSQRLIKAKDLMLLKTKEAAAALIEKKDKNLAEMKNKVEQMTVALSAGPAQAQAAAIRELEKQNVGLNKMLDMYKAKVQSLSNLLKGKGDDASLKDELRKTQMLSQQFKNQVEATKKELQRLQDKTGNDFSIITTLRKEKNLLEQQLKKVMQEASTVKEKAEVNNPLEQDLKKTQIQLQLAESQLKDATQRLKDTEGRLLEALKAQKNGGPSDDASKAKISHLEANVAKLSRDLVDAKNQMGEMKKETNKLRQEKTALQNMVEKLKKEAEKANKIAASKKQGKRAA